MHDSGAVVSAPRDAAILRSFARRIDAADPGAQNNLGVLYFRRGLFDEAIEAFSRALALDERMRVARRNLEIAYGKAGSLKSRTVELEQRLATSPDDIGALVECGIAEKSAGNLDLAEKRFRRALQHDPESSVLHFFLAELYYNRGNGEEALRFLRRSIDLNPSNPDAHYLAGFILGDLGRVDEAREANRLMLRASIINRATYAQPFPLLRLTLQDRYGSTLGERDIGPADYLPGAGAPTLLGPGERADALIRIVDPGTQAVGFELDVCLPASGGVRCANPVETASQ